VSVSNISLSDDIAVDAAQIDAVRLEEKGAKISSRVVSVAAGDVPDLTVPEDSVIVRLKDGSEFVIRGEEAAKRAWSELEKARQASGASFESTVNRRS
jgi:hypothetical protein